MSLMEGALLTNPVQWPDQCNIPDLHVRAGVQTDQRSNCIVADNLTANVASFILSELVAELLLCCATQVPNLNGITKRLGGVGRSVAQGGQACVPCFTAVAGLKEKLTTALITGRFFTYISATSIPCRMKR